jgi:hypothetical protein
MGRAVSLKGMAGSAAAGNMRRHIPGATRIDSKQATPIRSRGAVYLDSIDGCHEPLGGRRVVMVRVIDQQLDKALRLLKRQLSGIHWRELKARAF